MRNFSRTRFREGDRIFVYLIKKKKILRILILIMKMNSYYMSVVAVTIRYFLIKQFPFPFLPSFGTEIISKKKSSIISHLTKNYY